MLNPMCSRFTWSLVMCSCKLACTPASGDEGRSSALTLTSILNAASFNLSWISETVLGAF